MGMTLKEQIPQELVPVPLEALSDHRHLVPKG
jgi:hypothetical protein